MGVREDTGWTQARTPAERLRWARAANGLTQEAFGERVSMGRGAYRKYESGETAIKYEHATPWGRKLGVRGQWILDGRGTPFPEGAEQELPQKVAELVAQAPEADQESILKAVELMVANKRTGTGG